MAIPRPASLRMSGVILLLGLISGVITGLSPCVLPILPVVMTAAGGVEGAAARRRPYVVIAGLVTSFALFTLLGAIIISALGLPQDVLRWTGLVLLAAIGVGMLVPAIGHALERPFARVPMTHLNRDGSGLVLGMGLGLVFVPCAGPILAAITVLAATGRVDGQLVALTFAFALGVAIPLLFFALAGQRLAERVRTNRTRSRRLRQVLGGVLVVTSTALALGLAAPLQRATPEFLAGLQERLEDSDAARDTLGSLTRGGATTSSDAAERESRKLGDPISFDDCADDPGVLRNCGPAREFEGIETWLNSERLSIDGLRGNVVLVDFWTYSCINCQRSIPHIEQLARDYRAAGLVVVGVHTPEFAFEKVVGNIADNARRLGVTYPIAVDNGYETWTNYEQRYWPARYLIDQRGVVRQVHYGEGAYEETEQAIRTLLAADTEVRLPEDRTTSGETVTADATPETYLGSNRISNVVGTPVADGDLTRYEPPAEVPLDTFAFGGQWQVQPQYARAGAGASLRLHFTAAKVHLVLGGTGTVTGTLDGQPIPPVRVSGSPRLHTLLTGDPRTGVLELRLTPGLRAYAFTFG